MTTRDNETQRKELFEKLDDVIAEAEDNGADLSVIIPALMDCVAFCMLQNSSEKRERIADILVRKIPQLLEWANQFDSEIDTRTNLH
jgi:hypothetical protein